MADKQVFPTKGNLIALKKSYALAQTGYELMDRKRNILTREMMSLLDDVRLLRDEITVAYQRAYFALQQANMSLGVISDIVEAVPIDTGLHVTYRSVMGVEIPKLIYDQEACELTYGLARGNSKLDYAYRCFHQVKVLSVTLAEVDNALYRLANAIRKSQKRANALKNIVIPDFEHNIKWIAEALEEKEREEFTRHKVIKKKKDQKQSDTASL